MKAYRQGELLFIPVDNPMSATQIKRELGEKAGKVIREGETTGHKHEIEGNGLVAEMNGRYVSSDGEGSEGFSLPNGEMFLTAEDNIVIKHPEHKPLKLDKGNYVVRIKREYDEAENHRVTD